MIAFLLIVIGLTLIFINVKAIKKEKGSFSEALKGSMENIDEYKEEMGLIRKEFAETLIDIQKEIEYLKKELNVSKGTYENNREEKNYYNTNYLKENYNNLEQSNYIDYNNLKKISQETNKKVIINEMDTSGDIGIDEVNTNNLEKNSSQNNNNKKNNNRKKDNSIEKKKNYKKNISKDDKDKNSLKNDNSIKVNEVSKLLKEGHNTEEICEILNIGKGEVILIKELYLK